MPQKILPIKQAVIFAQSLAKDKKYDKSIDICSQILKKHPDLYLIRLLRARLHTKLCSFDKSILDYEKLLDLDAALLPMPPYLIYYNIAQNYQNSRLYDKALMYYQ